MHEFDEATRRALSQRYGPTPDAEARVLAKLRGTLGGPLGPDTGGGGEAAPAGGGTGQVVWMAKICAATAGLTGVGLVVLKLGASVLTNSDERDPNESRDAVEALAPAREPPPTASPELPADLDAPSPVASPAAAGIQTPTKRRSSATSSTLAAELVLLDAAERVRKSDPETALARLDQHRQEFPTGALAPEREAMRLEVSCALGRAPATDCRGTGSDKTGD